MILTVSRRELGEQRLSLSRDCDCNFDPTHQIFNVLKPPAHRLLDGGLKGDVIFAGVTIGGHSKFLLGVCFTSRILVDRDLQVLNSVVLFDRFSFRCFVVEAFVAYSS